MAIILKLSSVDKDELAIALVLWKGFKSVGVAGDSDISLEMFKLAGHLGIIEQVEKMVAKLPAMEIVPL